MRFDREQPGEFLLNGGVAKKECAFIQPPASHPRGDFEIRFARVAGAARRNDVHDRVAAAVRYRLYAVPLQGRFGISAVRASAPRGGQPFPVLGAEVVVDLAHLSLPLARGTLFSRRMTAHAFRI